MSKFLLFFVLFLISINCSSIRGVNLGGWLLLKPWITPSLFDPFLSLPFSSRAIDEFTFNHRLGPIEAYRQLDQHWRTFIQESDFKQIHDFGFSHVRIPFGWWIFGDSPSFVHNITYLDLALEWANKYGLKVLLDLHGAPGSQNGFDNSGVACNKTYFGFLGTGCGTDCQETPDWSVNKLNLLLTQKILLKLAERYKSNPAIWGLGLVNEPLWGKETETVKQWYDETYNILKLVVPEWKIVMDFSMISFPNVEPQPWPKDFMPNWRSYNNQVILDHHIYLWPVVLDMTPEEILDFSCGFLQAFLYLNNQKEIPSIIGEWSLAIDDCAKWLTGLLSVPMKEKLMEKGCDRIIQSMFFKEYAKNQLWMFEQTEGWFFWTYKNEFENEWSWVKLVENGWVPRDAREIAEFVKGSRCEKKKNDL